MPRALPLLVVVLLAASLAPLDARALGDRCHTTISIACVERPARTLPPVLTAVPGEGAVLLTWTPPATPSPLVHYEVHRGACLECIRPFVTVPPLPVVGGGAFADAEVEPGLSYYYEVVAVTTNEQVTSNTASGKPLTLAQDDHGPILAVVPGNAATTLHWAFQSTGAAPSGFNVYRGTCSGCGSFLAYVPASGASAHVATYSDPTLAHGTTYYYKVRAVHNTGVSAPSNEASAIRAATGESVVVTWTQGSGPSQFVTTASANLHCPFGASGYMGPSFGSVNVACYPAAGSPPLNCQNPTVTASLAATSGWNQATVACGNSGGMLSATCTAWATGTPTDCPGIAWGTRALQSLTCSGSLSYNDLSDVSLAVVECTNDP